MKIHGAGSNRMAASLGRSGLEGIAKGVQQSTQAGGVTKPTATFGRLADQVKNEPGKAGASHPPRSGAIPQHPYEPPRTQPKPGGSRAGLAQMASRLGKELGGTSGLEGEVVQGKVVEQQGKFFAKHEGKAAEAGLKGEVAQWKVGSDLKNQPPAGDFKVEGKVAEQEGKVQEPQGKKAELELKGEVGQWKQPDVGGYKEAGKVEEQQIKWEQEPKSEVGHKTQPAIGGYKEAGNAAEQQIKWEQEPKSEVGHKTQLAIGGYKEVGKTAKREAQVEQQIKAEIGPGLSAGKPIPAAPADIGGKKSVGPAGVKDTGKTGYGSGSPPPSPAPGIMPGGLGAQTEAVGKMFGRIGDLLGGLSESIQNMGLRG